MPQEELFIFQADVPGPSAGGPAGRRRLAWAYPPRISLFARSEQPVTKRTKGGEVRIVDSSKFKVSTTMAAAMVTVHPGGMRELHWHPNADEWQYYISGKGRMTVIRYRRPRAHHGLSGRRRWLRPEDAAALHREYGRHRPEYFWRCSRAASIRTLSLSEWLTHTPPELVMAHLRIDKATLDAIPKEEFVVVPS